MFGAIIGDINGSIYQDKYLSKDDIVLNQNSMYFTDDTVLTISLMNSLNNLYPNVLGFSEDVLKNRFIKDLKFYTRKYIDSEYGERYLEWATSDTYYQPYSKGNGSAMRVSPVSYVANSLEEAEYLARVQASITHDTKEGIKGAVAIASSIFLAKNGYSKDYILSYIESKYYPNIKNRYLNNSDNLLFDCSCEYTVPLAIYSFYISNSFIDTIKTAIACGGDTDTISAMAASIAEAYYKNIDRTYYNDLLKDYLPKDLLRIVNKFDKLYCNEKNKN